MTKRTSAALLCFWMAVQGLSLAAQSVDFAPALHSASLQPPATHTRDEIRKRLAVLDGLAPGAPYRTPVSARAPFAAGSLNPQYIAHGLATLNAFRYLAGLSDNVVADPSWSETAQYGAALLVIIGKGLNHQPAFPTGIGLPRDFYDKGYAGTTTSNLDQGGSDLSASVRDWMDDSDQGNIDRVGHRRWVLLPATESLRTQATQAAFVDTPAEPNPVLAQP